MTFRNRLFIESLNRTLDEIYERRKEMMVAFTIGVENKDSCAQ